MTRSIQPAPISTTTFDDILSAGNIDILSNIDLRKAILDYYTMIQRQDKILSNNLSDWATVLSELIPGEMGLYVRSGQRNPTTNEINQLKNNLSSNLDRIMPIINAELSHTGLQHTYNRLAKEANKRLLAKIDSELGIRSK